MIRRRKVKIAVIALVLFAAALWIYRGTGTGYVWAVSGVTIPWPRENTEHYNCDFGQYSVFQLRESSMKAFLANHAWRAQNLGGRYHNDCLTFESLRSAKPLPKAEELIWIEGARRFEDWRMYLLQRTTIKRTRHARQPAITSLVESELVPPVPPHLMLSKEMKTLLILLAVISLIQSAAASATYYDGQSAAFVLVDDKRIEDLRDGTAILRVAVKPPAHWCGVVGYPRIEVTDFPVKLLAKIAELHEPAFIVFYSERKILTEKRSEVAGNVQLGGDQPYKIGILTSTKLYSLSDEKIELQEDTVDWIESYRKFLNHEDPKERNFYLGYWAGE